jgi:diacylglycerol kinase (ATP)
MTKDLFCIINLESGGGSSSKKVKPLVSTLEKLNINHELIYTKSKGHATALARELVKEKVPAIAAVGGDGTVSEVAAGFFTEEGQLIQGKEKLTKVLIVPTGSGCDLARTLNLPSKLSGCISLIKDGSPRNIDMGVVHSTDEDGTPIVRPFINIVDVGMGGEVIEIMEKKGKGWFPTLDYFFSTVQGLIQYENKFLEVDVEGNKVKKEMNIAVVANGKFFGSGMKIAPSADPFDGKFTVVLIDAMSKPYLLSKLGALREGRHMNQPGVTTFEAKKVKISSPGRAMLDLDGELAGVCPMEVSMVEAAVPVFLPK